jgi:hypothetical protein
MVAITDQATSPALLLSLDCSVRDPSYSCYVRHSSRMLQMTRTYRFRIISGKIRAVLERDRERNLIKYQRCQKRVPLPEKGEKDSTEWTALIGFEHYFPFFFFFALSLLSSLLRLRQSVHGRYNSVIGLRIPLLTQIMAYT